MIVRDGESKDLPMDLLLALDELEKLNNSPHCEHHAVRILSAMPRAAAPHLTSHVRNGKRSGAFKRINLDFQSDLEASVRCIWRLFNPKLLQIGKRVKFARHTVYSS
jgi:hypothetical protein